MITKIYDKISKLPKWTGIVAVIVAAIVANIPMMLNFDVLWNSILASYAEAGIDVSGTLGNLPDSYKYVVALLGALVTWGIMELIAYVVIWIMSGSGRVRDKKYFYNAVRFTYAVYKLIVGLYSLADSRALLADRGLRSRGIRLRIRLVEFYSADVAVYAVLSGYQEKMRQRQFRFQYLFPPLFGMVHISGNSLSVEFYVDLLGLVAVAALVLYLTVYRKLKKEQDDNRSNFIPPVPPQRPGGQGDDEIFRGYGL